MPADRQPEPICPGYRLADSTDLPEVTFDNGLVVAVRSGDEAVRSPEIHQCIAGWILMAVIERAGQAVAVFEEASLQRGRIAFVTANGPLRIVPKSLEPTSEGDAG